MRPNRSTARSMTRLHCASSARSASINTALRPSASTSARVCSASWCRPNTFWRGWGYRDARHAGGVTGVGAVNAFGGACYGLAGAVGVPREWLEGSLFSDYTIPSIVLGAVVGGSFLLAATAVFGRWRSARVLAAAAGVIVLGWIAVQVAIIGYVSWMQPVTAAWGVAILIAARLLPVSE